jgi:hypothetical protein
MFADDYCRGCGNVLPNGTLNGLCPVCRLRQGQTDDRRPVAAPGHCADLRIGRVRRSSPLFRHEAGQGTYAVDLAGRRVGPGSRLAPTALNLRVRLPDDSLCPRPRCDPSRPEALEHHGRLVRRGAGKVDEASVESEKEIALLREAIRRNPDDAQVLPCRSNRRMHPSWIASAGHCWRGGSLRRLSGCPQSQSPCDKPIGTCHSISNRSLTSVMNRPNMTTSTITRNQTHH